MNKWCAHIYAKIIMYHNKKIQGSSSFMDE